MVSAGGKLIAAKRKARREGWASWIRSEADERAVMNGCRFDLRRAERVERFFATFLCHSKGTWAGKPFELLPWQRDDLFYPLFGWIRQDERGEWVRRYRKAYVEIPKKNGKSTIASGVGLYMLAGDGEMGAEVYSAATDRQQAGIVHGEAINMVDASPELSEALTINRSTNTISFPDTRSFYRALAATPKSNEGWNAHCIIADELHKWYGRKLFDALRWAFAARSQPLFFIITTSGDDLTSVCREQHDYARGILEGKFRDDGFFAYIRAADPQRDDLNDPKTWHKANPSLGVTITLESFQADYDEAKASPSSFAAWKRYRINIWTSSKNPWLRMEDWNRGRREYAEQALFGMKCWAGLDLSRTRDTTSLQLVFPWDDDGEGRFRLLSYFWLPEATARAQDHLVPWLAWADAGLVELIPGEVLEYSYVRKKAEELAKRFQIAQVAFDPLFAEETSQYFEDALGIERFAFKQSMMNFAPATDEFERLVISGRMEHAGHEVMDWQIGNVNLKTDANANKRPVKPEPNDYRKIDGPVAAIMGLARALGLEEKGSAYDEPGKGVVLI